MAISGMTVVVTGGSGFVGSHIVDTLLSEGARVISIDKKVGGQIEHKELTSHVVDIAKVSIEVLASLIREADFVVHCAAFVSVPASILKPLESHESNVTGTLKMLLASRDAQVKRFISFSSSAVYGSTEVLPATEDLPYMPESPYAAQKMMGEEYARLASALWGLETVRIRPFNIYGEGQSADGGYAAVIPKFIATMKSGERPVIFGDGEATRDFVYVDDVVNAVVLSLVAPDISGAVFNVASGVETSLNQLVREINAILGTHIEPIYEKGRQGDIVRSVADITRAHASLLYEPRVPLAEGLARTIQFAS